MLFLSGLELASKSQVSPCLRLPSAEITSTCPNVALCSYMGSGTSDYSCKHVSFWAIISPAPENIFHFHCRAVTRLQTPPTSTGMRMETKVFCLQLPSPCLLQLTYKNYPKHLVQKAWRSEASETSLSQASLSGMETRFGLLGEQSLFYENW